MNTAVPRLVGMIHLGPLPGSPAFSGSIDDVERRAVEDARTLLDAGFDMLMIENFGDAPFFADSVPPETVACMTRCVNTVRTETGSTVGVNVLRNDALAALGIAAATGAEMIRVNVLTGTMYTDQGPIVGKAAELARKRQAVAPDVEIWADVMVKHATPPPGLELGQAAIDTMGRGGADALIISGSGTGSSPRFQELKVVRDAVGTDAHIAVGSGVTPDNLAELATLANTLIVGSYTKIDGVALNPVDSDRAAEIVAVARKKG